MPQISSERKSNSARNNAIIQAMGDEPVWDTKKDESQLGSLLNWYSQNKNSEDARSWFLQYFKNVGKPENELNRINKLPAWQISTYGYLARMLLVTENIPEKYKNKLEEKYKTVVNLIPEEVKEVVSKETPNIQDRLQQQLNEYIAEIEGWIDDFLYNNLQSTVSPIEWYKENQIKPLQIKNISEHYKEHNIKELNLALSGKDSQLQEAYSFLGTSGLKKLIGFIELIITDADKWHDLSKKIATIERKPRKRKPKPPIKQVAKLQYLREHGEYKSIPPTQIVGAEQLWVYNTKYRTLGVYVCDNAHGFSVKGCSILNFNELESIGKKLRKPEKTIPQVLSAGKVALRKILPSIKAKEKRLTGRINKDTILLKVI